MLDGYISHQRNYIFQSIDQKQFRDFKYRGGTDSLTYQYIWGPLAEKLVLYFPLTMSPNVITMMSIILITGNHLIFMFWGDNKEISAWKLILMGVSILIYQTLDNIDGKQARRTGSGSPLGMLFDHGVDSLCSFMLALQFLKIIRIDNYNTIMLAIFVFIMLPFFSALWHQYSTGVFKLGRINPVDEGLPALAIFAFISSFFRIQGLDQFHIFAPLNEEILISLGFFLIILLISMNRDVFRNAIRPAYDTLQILCLPVILGIALVYTNFMEKNIYYERVGLQVVYSLLFCWSRNMVEIQLCYVSGQRFNFFNIGTNVFLFSHIGYLSFGKELEKYSISAQMYFWFLVGVNCFVFFEFIISVFNQGKKLLGINIFNIKKAKTK